MSVRGQLKLCLLVVCTACISFPDDACICLLYAIFQGGRWRKQLAEMLLSLNDVSINNVFVPGNSILDGSWPKCSAVIMHHMSLYPVTPSWMSANLIR